MKEEKRRKHRTQTMEKKLRHCTAGIIFAVIGFFFLSIMARFISKNLLFEAMNMDNGLVRTIWWDYLAGLEKENEYESIDWAQEYPFSGIEKKSNNSFLAKKVNRYVNKINTAENTIEDYATDYLINRVKLIEYANNVEKLMGWNLQCYADYNSVTFLEDNYLTGIERKKDSADMAANIELLKEYLDDMGIPLLYVHVPGKICPYIDGELAQTIDFSNKNADELLDNLEQAGVSYLDLRENIHEQGLNHHELYYITDHHWRAETGLWATGEIAGKLNNDNGFDIDLSIYNSDNYEYTLYPEWFLGSQGKKVTLAKTKADDFVLIKPCFETSLMCEIPSLGMSETGDFSVLIDESRYKVKDVYNMSPYHAYSWGDNALMTVTNLKTDSEKSVLLIHDSYGDVVSPFMALGVKKVYALDLREFTGSLRSFIEKEQPDAVIVMYYAGSLQENVSYERHDSSFDFR